MQPLLKVHDVSIDKASIRLDPDEILQILGEQQGVIDTHATTLVKQYIVEGLRISAPVGAFVLVDALESLSSEKIGIQGITFDTGKIVHKMLQNSENYAFFLVSAGPGPENLVRSLLQQGDYLEGYILDLVASNIVDLAADQVQDQVKSLAERQGLRITNRYSPGYCDWNVEEQQKLFSLFPVACCGISLSESSLMSPMKSISGIIGAGAKVKFRDYTCEICPMPECYFRKVRNQ
jgi:hypothetical protein